VSWHPTWCSAPKPRIRAFGEDTSGRHLRRAPLIDRQAGLPPRVPRARTAHAGVHLPTAPRLCLRPANKQPLGRARTRAAGVLKDVAAFAAAQ